MDHIRVCSLSSPCSTLALILLFILELPHVRYIKVKSFSIIPYRQREEKRDKAPKGPTKTPSDKESNVGSETPKKKTEKKAEPAAAEKEDKGGQDKDLDEVQVTQNNASDQQDLDSDAIEEIEELLDVDGELKGSTPFTCEVIPCALRVIL